MAKSPHNRSIDYATLPDDLVILPLAAVKQMEAFQQRTADELQRLRLLILTQGSGYLTRTQAMDFLGIARNKFNNIRGELARSGDRYCIESCRAYLNRQRIDPEEIDIRIDQMLAKK